MNSNKPPWPQAPSDGIHPKVKHNSFWCDCWLVDTASGGWSQNFCDRHAQAIAKKEKGGVALLWTNKP